jgi:hypothetical protein
MRRWLLMFAALIGLASNTVGTVSAQDGPPADSSFSNEVLSTYGLPEIVIKDEGEGLIDPPTELEAGKYLVTIEETPDIWVYVNFVQAPTGLTEEELEKQFLDAAAMDVVSPGWIFAGGSISMPGSESSYVVDLAEGDWYIGATHTIGEEEEIPQLYPLKVTAATNDQAQDFPDADVHAKLSDMKYAIAEESVKTGPQTWEFSSDSSQSHHVVIARTTELVTPDDVAQWAEGMFSDTPTPTKMDGMVWAGYTALLSKDQTVRAEFNFDPGNYVLICFIMDPETQMPHLMHGMSTSFVVEE